MATDSHDLNAVIDRHLHAFDKPGVLSVRPGFKVTNGWLTSQRAIVVTVRRKVAQPPPDEALPTEVQGIPTDVRQASSGKREEIEHPEAYAEQLRLAPDLGSVPHFADERRLDGTRPGPQASAHAQLEASVKKPQLTYSGPDGQTLQPVQAQATIHLSASPDSGWTTLSAFLQATTKSLSVGLYDFTSKHVLDAVSQALAGKKLNLVLDHPAQNPTADQTDADTVTDLRQTLSANLDQAWALSRMDPEATSWIFPTAYHIKVAVRDQSVFWLSSGNWNNSNQPAIDPVSNPGDAAAARHGDRDWHVVIELAELAHVFEQFILHDLSTAAAHNAPPEQPGPALPAPGLGSTQTRAFAQFFPAQTITETVTITPLLTPDPGVYADTVKALIASAQHTLYMQFQYIEPPKVTDATSQAFVDLITAVIDRQNHGVQVKIIMSEFETAGYLEQLQSLGLDVVNNVKIQNNVHNKGVVVDTQSVLVSSQNWSTDGTLYNRDAGVILASAAAAQYFEQIFLHDWEHLAHQHARSD
jgi:hypothetical protein